MRQYARKSQRGQEPNDRHYSRKIEAKIKRMRPDELDELIHGEQEDTGMPPRQKVEPEPGQGVPLRTF